VGPEEASLDKRRRILGADKMDRQQGGSRVRTPFSVVTNTTATSDTADAAEGAVVVDFTKDEVEALLNEKKKGNTYDNKVFVMFFI